jgi:hypothetical protein
MATSSPTPDPPGSDQPSSQLLAALEACWAAIARHHAELPAAVVVVGAGSGSQGLWKWGHFAALRWRRLAGGDALREVLVAGEGLRRPASEVLATLLHEAAHAIADCRGVQDTSRDGRYHNRRYRAIAEEVGLDVELAPPYGHTRTTLRPETAERYAAQIQALEAALVVYRVAETPPARRQRLRTPAGDDQDPDQQDGGQLDDGDAGDQDGGRRRDYNLLPAACACLRRIRIAPSVLAAGAITCGVCAGDFLLVE